MTESKFQLILTEPGGNFAIPDITITNEFQSTFSIQSAADISKRKDTLTQSITFPGTKNNNRIFNNLYSLNRDADGSLEETLFYNYSPVVGVRAVLYENNYPLVSGVLTIQDIVKDKATGAYTYTGTITGNLVNFFGSIRDVLVQDLPLFDSDESYTWDNIKASWDWAEDKDFVYGSIDYGKGITPDPSRMDLRNFRPGIYGRKYIKALLGHYGYRYRSTYIDSDLFNRAYIPFGEIDFGETETGIVETFNGVNRAQINMNRNDASECLIGMYVDDFTTNPYVDMSIQNAHGINGGWGRQTVLNDRQVAVFKFKKASNTSAVFTYDFSVFSHASTTQVQIQLFKLYDSVQLISDPFPHPVDFPYTFDADSPLASVYKGYGSEAKLVWTNITGSIQLPVDNYDKDYQFALIITTATDRGDDLELMQNSIKVEIGNPDVQVGSVFSYDLGDTFNLNNQTPRGIKAQDLLRSFFTTFNMYAIENPDDDKELIIEPYDLFYSKTMNPAKYALDWTKKVDNSSLHIKVNTALPKTYNLKFTEDSDYYNTLYKKTWGVNYGDLSIDNKIGTADPKDITSIFAATPVVTENKDDKTLPAIFTGDLTAKKPIKSKPRILFNNGSAACHAYSVVITKGEAGSLTYDVKETNVNSYNVSHHVLNLGDGPVFNLLFDIPKAVYYTVSQDIFTTPLLYSLFKSQLIELDDINLYTLELDCDLKDFDISVLDLTRPIFINTTQGAAYFKIMSVVYFNTNEVSNVILQKIVMQDTGVAVLPPPNPAPVPKVANFKASPSFNLGFHTVEGVTAGGIPTAGFKDTDITNTKTIYTPKVTAGTIKVETYGLGSLPPFPIYLVLNKNSTTELQRIHLTSTDGIYTLTNPADILAPDQLSIEIIS
jgi:hypothetical protein